MELYSRNRNRRFAGAAALELPRKSRSTAHDRSCRFHVTGSASGRGGRVPRTATTILLPATRRSGASRMGIRWRSRPTLPGLTAETATLTDCAFRCCTLARLRSRPDRAGPRRAPRASWNPRFTDQGAPHLAVRKATRSGQQVLAAMMAPSQSLRNFSELTWYKGENASWHPLSRGVMSATTTSPV